MQNNLTSLKSVKDWAGVTATNDDQLLSGLISSASRFILSYLQRPTLFQNTFSDVYDGTGGRRQVLRNFPVLSVAQVIVGSISIPAASNPVCSGYVLDPWDGYPPGRPQSISLRGHEFWRGFSNVQITYSAGFVIQNEPQTIPAGAPYAVQVNAPHGNWAVDQGVTYATGIALTPITSGTPAQGQYTVINGIYTLAAADAGLGVLISYSYVPADIDQVCKEMVSERYKYRERIGTITKSLGGQESVSFSQKDMPDFLRTTLQPYRRVVLV